MEEQQMAQGEFAKAYAAYLRNRKSQGMIPMNRSEFAKSNWKIFIPKQEHEEVKENV
jgi:hypothetical protein